MSAKGLERKHLFLQPFPSAVLGVTDYGIHLTNATDKPATGGQRKRTMTVILDIGYHQGHNYAIYFPKKQTKQKAGQVKAYFDNAFENSHNPTQREAVKKRHESQQTGTRPIKTG